ncbi:pumilio-like protein 1 [Hordeum vulgare]|nr:pumilio-like protein 1 [Hordeum vulgare]
MFEDPAETAHADDGEEEIRVEAPPPKKKKLMTDAILTIYLRHTPTKTILRHTLLPKSGELLNTKRDHADMHHTFTCSSAKIDKHAYQLDRPHLPLQPEFEDNIVVMDDTHSSSATAREAAQAVAVEAARNAPTPPPQLKTRDEQMSFLISTIRGMEKNISEILLNQKNLERIMKMKFHDLDVKVTELTTTVEQLQHEVDLGKIPRSDVEDDDDDDDDDSPLRTTTQFMTHTRS